MNPSNPHVVTTVKCAGPNCSHIRREVNHWFIVWVDAEVFRCEKFKTEAFDASLDAKPVCGQQCAQKLFEEFMGKATREAEA